MTVPRELWYLPRPRRENKYVGGFPAYFEKRLFEMYRWPEKILQPFGGKSEYGIRCDLNSETNPDYVCDALNMPFPDSSFDFVLCDPPYSADLSGKLYSTAPVNYNKMAKEAVRVCKVGGYIALYHWVMSSRPKGTRYDRIIVIIGRVRHFARICCIFQKTPDLFGELH